MFTEACQAIEHEIIAWRRDFHQHPELSFQEKRTAVVIATFLKECGLEVQEQVHGYGVIGDLIGQEPGPTIAFRADMDALPIQEETGVDFASQTPGVMHACGHDGHMAALMGAVRILAGMKDKIKGRIRFIFQPAEEVTPGGALGMIKAGALEGVDVIFGVHLWSEFPTGSFYTAVGPIMAAADEFSVSIKGKGGHGALPHQTVDALVVAAHLVMASQHIISRQLDPLASGVISFGSIQAGTAFNVIADQAVLGGTVRSFTSEVRDLLEQGLGQTAASIGQMYGAEIQVNYERGYPPVVNHQREAELALTTAEKLFTRAQVGFMQPIMAGEDFSYFLEKVPGAFCFVGAGDESQVIYPHHHPCFNIDERALFLATKWFCQMAEHYVMN